MGANATTVAEIIRELWETPFVEAFARVSFLYRFFGRQGGGGDGPRWKAHYAGNGAASSYGLDDTPPAAGNQAYARAHLPWKRNWITIQVDGLVQAETRGAGGFLEAQASEISEALQDLILEIDSQMLGDGSGNGGKDIDGIAAAVSATGIYATVDRTTATWWRSYVQAVANASVLTEDLVKAHLDALFGDGARRIDPNDFVLVCSRTDWRNLGNDIQDNGGSRRLQTQKLEGGFTAIMVDETPVIWAPTFAQGTAYGFSKSDWSYRVLQDLGVEPLGKTRDSVEVFANTYSNLQCKNPRRQSKFTGLKAAP